MKKIVKFMSMVMFGVLCLLPTAVFAKEAPVYEINENNFFANGTPIVIEERTDGIKGANITWDDGNQLVNEKINIFGGGHETDTVYDSTSITMNSGQVNNIIGGGLHKSYVKTTNVVINGGSLVGINGGGASSATWTKCHRPWFDEKPATDAINKVDVANLTINGGQTAKAGFNSVLGGGEGISYTGTANVTVNDGTWDYVTAGGSNGYTGKAILKVTGGTISVLQSVNRGSMDSADMTITGGTIANAYVGGETTDANVNGVIAAAAMNITGGFVTNLYVGTSGGKDSSAKDVATVKYLDSAVTNVDKTTFDSANIVENITITFSANGIEETIIVPKGSILTATEIEELKNIVKEGYKVVGYYTDAVFTTEYDLTAPFNVDTTIYMKVEKVEEVKNPDTSDLNVGLMITLMGLSAIGLGYAFKTKKV